MAKHVAGAAKQNISEKKSSPAQSSSAGSPPKDIHSEPAVQLSSVPVPIPRLNAGRRNLVNRSVFTSRWRCRSECNLPMFRFCWLFI